jgi:hypothetical protein
MSNQNGLNDLIGVIEFAAPTLATLMGGPLGGALASGVVNALQAGGVGSDLPAPVTPGAMAPVAQSAPLALLRMVLAVLEQQASDHLNEVTAISPASGGGAATLPYSDAGVQVNGLDATAKFTIAVVGTVVAAVGIVSPATGSLLSQYTPVVGGILAAAISMFLNHRTVAKSNVNTAALQNAAR